MKQKIILYGSITLMLAIVLFMAWDLFFNKTDDNVNPYAYDLQSLRSGDSTGISYTEQRQFTTRLVALHGIATDKSDLIYICGENGVEVLDTSGKLVNQFGITGIVQCICVADEGLIFLGVKDHIEIFNPSGKKVQHWKSCGMNSVITSVAVTKNNVYIADAGSRVVLQCDLSGNLVKKIGEKDPERSIPGFIVPSPYFDLAIGRDGSLWVVNPGWHQFEQYNQEGAITATWGVSSMAREGFCGCCNPSNFAILSDGSFVTSEKGIERIKVYLPDGKFKSMVAGPDSFIEGTIGLDLAVDSRDRIYVLDPEKRMVRVFVSKK